MKRTTSVRLIRTLIISLSLSFGLLNATALAVTNPQSDSIGLQATITSAPPSQSAPISAPGNGTTVTSLPTTVSGTCPDGVVIKVFDNGVFVGSAACVDGTYSLQIDLFSGTNALTTIDYDALSQAGPTSNQATVTYSGPSFSSLAPTFSITSVYAERGANPGTALTWPISISGGVAPYALSVDWGDGQPPEVLSAPASGSVTLTHTYTSSGTYAVVIRATDSIVDTAFFQLVGVANGPVNGTISNIGSGKTATPVTKQEVLWWPAAISIPLMFATFWLGRRYQIGVLRKQLENQNQP